MDQGPGGDQVPAEVEGQAGVGMVGPGVRAGPPAADCGEGPAGWTSSSARGGKGMDQGPGGAQAHCQQQAGPTQPPRPPEPLDRRVLTPGQGRGVTTPQLPVPMPDHPARLSRTSCRAWRSATGDAWSLEGHRAAGPSPGLSGGPRLRRGAGPSHGLQSPPLAVGRADGQSKMVLKSAVTAGLAAASRAARVGPGSCRRSRAWAVERGMHSEPLSGGARDRCSPGTPLRPRGHPRWAGCVPAGWGVGASARGDNPSRPEPRGQLGSARGDTGRGLVGRCLGEEAPRRAVRGSVTRLGVPWAGRGCDPGSWKLLGPPTCPKGPPCVHPHPPIRRAPSRRL